MALLSESLVEEWLNRTGFFTIRGIKHGVGELDLLSIRREADGSITGWHVEVQSSFRPIGYIAKLTSELIGKGEKTRSRTSAVARSPEEVELCAREWVRAKFRANDKIRVREKLWPGIVWSYHLVHAVVREPRELTVFESEGVKCHPFHDVLSDLLRRGQGIFSGSAGGDLAEIVGYYNANATHSQEDKA
jgi:hypothetical protein